jgi:hypothetical protein
MNKLEARQLLKEELAKWRQKSHAELAGLMGQSHHAEVRSSSGRLYQVEIEVFWDDKPDDNIRVSGSIDDGGWRAFVPLTDSFILSPNGTFVDEDAG